MERFKKLAREIHRRSLWQVVGIYVLAGWAALQVVDTMSGALGLPDWFTPFAFALLIVGFPVVLATAFVQEGLGNQEDGSGAGDPSTAGGDSGGAGAYFNWKNAIGGGVVAFGILALVASVGAFKDDPVGQPLGAEDDLSAIAARADDQSIPAVAVLPFEDRGSDDQYAYFADGVHEDILTNLSKARGLLVISRTSVQRYRATELSMREIGEQLGATALVEGSVQRVGDQVRITAQLIDAQSDSHLWAENYDRTLDDVFAVQSEIALAVARQLEAALTPAEVARIESVPTSDLTAYEHYLRGRNEYEEYEEERNEIAIQRFQSALDLDPDFGLAWAGLADAYAQYSARWGGGSEWADSAMTAAERAVRLAPERTESYKALALAHSHVGQPDRAIDALEEALRLDPNNDAAANNLGVVLHGQGRSAEGLRWYKMSQRLNDEHFHRTNLASAYIRLGFPDRAREWLDRDIRIDGDNLQSNQGELWIAWTAGDQGTLERLAGERAAIAPSSPFARLEAAQFAAAALEWDQAERYLRDLERMGGVGENVVYKGAATIASEIALSRGDTALAGSLATERLAQLERPVVSRFRWMISNERGILLARLGRTEEAIDALEQSFDEHNDAYPFWVAERGLDSLREHPRFQQLLGRVKAHWDRNRAQVLEDEGRSAGG